MSTSRKKISPFGIAEQSQVTENLRGIFLARAQSISLVGGLLFLGIGAFGCATEKKSIVTLPRIDFRTAACRPEYPRAALRYEQQGMVELTAQVEIDGSISVVEVVRSSGYPILDNAIRNKLLQGDCKGTPGKIDGQVSVQEAKVQYVWKLD